MRRDAPPLPPPAIEPAAAAPLPMFHFAAAAADGCCAALRYDATPPLAAASASRARHATRHARCRFFIIFAAFERPAHTPPFSICYDTPPAALRLATPLYRLPIAAAIRALVRRCRAILSATPFSRALPPRSLRRRYCRFISTPIAISPLFTPRRLPPPSIFHDLRPSAERHAIYTRFTSPPDAAAADTPRRRHADAPRRLIF